MEVIDQGDILVFFSLPGRSSSGIYMYTAPALLGQCAANFARDAILRPLTSLLMKPSHHERSMHIAHGPWLPPTR